MNEPTYGLDCPKKPETHKKQEKQHPNESVRKKSSFDLHSLSNLSGDILLELEQQCLYQHVNCNLINHEMHFFQPDEWR